MRSDNVVMEINGAIDEVITMVDSVNGFQHLGQLLQMVPDGMDIKDEMKIDGAIKAVVLAAGVNDPTPTTKPFGFRFPIETPNATAVGYIRLSYDSDGLGVDHGFMRAKFKHNDNDTVTL